MMRHTTQIVKRDALRGSVTPALVWFADHKKQANLSRWRP